MNASGGIAKALLGALSLLLIGAVLGIAIDRHLGSARPNAGTPAAFHEMAMSDIARRLDLDSAQRRRIDSIIAERHHTLQTTWAVLHEQLGAAVDTVHRDVEAVLSPAQREQFRAWLREVGAGH
jgi:CO/xanthine dehydrogenase Mo-binding subunit